MAQVPLLSLLVFVKLDTLEPSVVLHQPALLALLPMPSIQLWRDKQNAPHAQAAQITQQAPTLVVEALHNLAIAMLVTRHLVTALCSLLMLPHAQLAQVDTMLSLLALLFVLPVVFVMETTRPLKQLAHEQSKHVVSAQQALPESLQATLHLMWTTSAPLVQRVTTDPAANFHHALLVLLDTTKLLLVKPLAHNAQPTQPHLPPHRQLPQLAHAPVVSPQSIPHACVLPDPTSPTEHARPAQLTISQPQMAPQHALLVLRPTQLLLVQLPVPKLSLKVETRVAAVFQLEQFSELSLVSLDSFFCVLVHGI